MNSNFILLTLILASNFHFGEFKSSKIYGGQLIDIESVPYFVSLESYKQHFCGGSIINNQWILSAAHCQEGIEPHFFSIRAGSSEKSKGGVSIPVANYYQHPNYNLAIVDNDFMLIKLKKPLVFSNKIQPITLADSSMYVDGTDALATGFGATQNTIESENFLRAVNLKLESQQNCGKNRRHFTANMICATAPKANVCQGDSGGPLVSLSATKALIGVSSFVIKKCEDPNPGYFAKVSQARDWIDCTAFGKCK